MKHIKRPLTEREKRDQRKAIMTVLKILNVNQRVLSEWLDVNRSLISMWKSGVCRISADQAIRLSKLCPEMPVEEFKPDIYKGLS